MVTIEISEGFFVEIRPGLISYFLNISYSSSLTDPDVKKNLESSFPHYGHSGIVEAARELFGQVEGNPIDDCE